MRLFRICSFIFCLSFCLSGCATGKVILSNKGSRVEIPKKVPFSCQLLKELTTHARHSDRSTAQAYARNEFLNQVGELKGDTAIIDMMTTDTQSDYAGRYRVNIEGRAFKCK